MSDLSGTFRAIKGLEMDTTQNEARGPRVPPYLIPDCWEDWIREETGIRKMTDEEIRKYEIEVAMEHYAYS